MEYATVGARLAQTTQNTPASVVVITGDQLVRAGYQSIGEALGSIPGIFISDDLQNVHVAIRGVFGGARAGSRSIRVLVDGVPISFMQSGVNLLGPEMIPLSSIERVEILKGPASALYGTGALVGAINIVTKRPAYEGELTFGMDLRGRGGLGGQRGGGGELSATLTGEKFSLLVGGSGDYLDRSGLKVPSGPFANAYAPGGVPIVSTNDSSTPVTGVLRADGALFGGRLSGLFVGQMSNRAAEFHDLSVLSHNTRVALYNMTASVQYERAFSSGFGIVARFGGNTGGPVTGDQYDFASTSSFVLKRKYNSRSLNANLEGRYEFENGGSVVVGGEWLRDLEDLPTYFEVDKATGASTARITPRLQSLTNVAAYMTGQYPVASWLTIAWGARYDFNTAVGSMFGARLGVVLPIQDRASIKVLFGRSHRAPSPEQLWGLPAIFGDVCGPDGEAGLTCSTTNPDGSVKKLEPQYLTGGEVSADVFLTRWLSLSLSGYGNVLEKNLAYVLSGNNLVPKAYNATQFGGEGLARLALPLGESFALDGSAGFSFQQTTTEQTLVAGFPLKDVPNNEAVPTVMANATAGFRYLPLKASLFIDYRYVGRRIPSQSNLRAAGTATLDRPIYDLAPYSLLNATVSITPLQFGPTKELSFLVRVTNILNAQWAEIGFNGVDVPNLGATAWLMTRLTL